MEEWLIWEVRCIPWNAGAIRYMTLYVEAKSREIAELIVQDKAHEFFDQDMHYIWNPPVILYKNI